MRHILRILSVILWLLMAILGSICRALLIIIPLEYHTHRKSIYLW